MTANMQLWGALAGRLHARTLSIPRHERLIAELRNLRQESIALGASFRVVDGTRKLHRDVSLALAGACLAAGTEDDTPLMLVSDQPGSAYQEWLSTQAVHALPEAQPVADEIFTMSEDEWNAMSPDEQAKWNEEFERVEKGS